MARRRIALGLIGALALGLMHLGSYASAHNGPVACAFTSAAGLPALINNVEGKGGPWSINSNGFWTGSEGADGDAMKASASDGFGHTGQALQNNARGLYYPINDPNTSHLTPTANPGGFNSLHSFAGDHFNWTNIDQCNNSGDALNTKGVGVGYCGRSVGLGVGTAGGHTAIIKWESVGSQLLLLDPSSTGSLNAQPNPPGSPNGSCVAGTAVQFNLNGVTVHQ